MTSLCHTANKWPSLELMIVFLILKLGFRTVSLCANVFAHITLSVTSRSESWWSIVDIMDSNCVFV